MKQRGRKSASTLGVISMDLKRPEPPDSLSTAQAGTWDQITGALPPEFFSADIQPLLLAYCKHIDYAAVIDREVDAFKPEWLKDDEGLRRFKVLTDIRGRETTTMLTLARSLRLTNQSRYTPQRAATTAGKGGSGKKLWE